VFVDGAIREDGLGDDERYDGNRRRQQVRTPSDSHFVNETFRMTHIVKMSVVLTLPMVSEPISHANESFERRVRHLTSGICDDEGSATVVHHTSATISPSPDNYYHILNQATR
jgi:hypothetical protein